MTARTLAYQANNWLVSTQTANYSYDANGSLLSKSDASGYWIYGWDYENRMTTARKQNKTVRYQYDALGRRISRLGKAVGVTARYTYDGMDVVMDDGSAGIIKYQNGLGIDNKLKVSIDGTAKYFLQDHPGSTAGLTDGNGTLVASANYDSFGNSTNNLTTRYQYTGREEDEFTGLNYYRARWYDANLGRFISEDPIGFRGGDVNLFGYVNNNSVNRKDPLGLYDPADWQAAQEALKAAVAAGGTAVGSGFLTVGAVAAGGFAAGYGIGYYPGQWTARYFYPEQFPDTQTQPETCSTKSDPAPSSAPLPAPTNTPRPFPRSEEPKRKCEFTDSFDNHATNKKHCIYKCEGKHFAGKYLIVTRVEFGESCPDPDKADNDWVPGGS